jgi:long-subunit acyl-CoA synthetase (AMP-forming)
LSCKANCHHPKKTRATFSHLAVESKPFTPAAMSYLADYRIGTVGNLLTGVNFKLAEDGETLNKGDNIFKGYWKMEKETRRSFTENGYFMSGDIGRLDDDGILSITDRKKNIIITSSSKNIAPQKVEGFFLMDLKKSYVRHGGLDPASKTY